MDITGYLTDGKGNWWEWVKIEDPEKEVAKAMLNGEK